MTAHCDDQRYRRSIRLRDWDYSQPAAYFVTLCSYERQLLFGEVIDGAVVLSEWGRVAHDE
jgi:putative transposase